MRYDYRREFFAQKNIVAGYAAFLEKLKEREFEWDIKPSEFIVENIQKQQLFFDPVHPTNSFLAYVAMEVCRLLNIDIMGIEARERMSLDSYEIPIYSSVHKALEFKYPPAAFIRRYNGQKLRDVNMDLKEYVRQYIIWNFNKDVIRAGSL